ncbi:helix-turn-helix domain-containing protein [Rhizobium ruizarguesonis]
MRNLQRYEKAITLYEQGHTTNQIAVILGVTRSRAIQMVRGAERIRELHSECEAAKHLSTRALNSLCTYFNLDPTALTPDIA